MLEGSFYLLDEENQVVRIVIKTQSKVRTIDLAALRGSIERDLLRRDFTVNALALDLLKSKCGVILTFPHDLIDYCGGWSDLEKGIICLVHQDGFSEDPARLLRAVRLARELGFRIDHSTNRLIKKRASQLMQVPAERLLPDLLALFQLPGVTQSILLADKLGFLNVLLPELAGLRSLTQDSYHHLDVWGHTLLTVKNLERSLLD